MGSNDELKEIDIKIHMCCYFNDIIKNKAFDFDILLDEKSHTKYFDSWNFTQNINSC